MSKLTSIFLFTALNVCFAFGQVPTDPKDISPLLIGERFPKVDLLSISNQTISTHELLDSTKTIVVFYRGGWCPYCTRHLSSLGEIEDEILRLGYKIVAVAPQGIEDLSGTSEELNLGFQLYSDKSGELIKQIGIAFQPNDKTISYMTKNSIETADKLLPVPSLFILDETGVILFEHIAPNYNERITPNFLRSILVGLKPE